MPHPYTPSSYRRKPEQGKTFYDSSMHILGYDPTTVGSSAVFYLLFEALRVMLGCPYWEQVNEYNAKPEHLRFNPNHLTQMQIDYNLTANSTREEILEAGYYPAPDLAHALEIEFQNFAYKMGGSGGQQSEVDPLGRKLACGPR